MKIILLLILSINLMACSAHDWRAGYLIGSEHYDPSQEYNEDNPGAYLCYSHICAGQYENSYSNRYQVREGEVLSGKKERNSRFVKYDHCLARWGMAEISTSLGLVDGYKEVKSDHQWMPFASLNFKFSIAQLWQIGKVSAYGLEIGNTPGCD